jgi:hypothetical protein
MVRGSFSRRCSGEARRRKCLICKARRDWALPGFSAKSDTMSRPKPARSALMSHRSGLPDFHGNSGMCSAKLSANAIRGPLDNFCAGAEQRHRFRLLALLDFSRGRCGRRWIGRQLPELWKSDPGSSCADRNCGRKRGPNFRDPASVKGKRIAADRDHELHQSAQHPAASLAAAFAEFERTPAKARSGVGGCAEIIIPLLRPQRCHRRDSRRALRGEETCKQRSAGEH